MRFYCPCCRRDFAEDLGLYPSCASDIEEFWKSKDYVEKLIIVLDHPEKGTPIQAAWLLEELKDARAVPPLIDLIKETKDVYIAREAVKALGKIGTQTACQFLSTLTQQQAKMVRDEVKCILSGRHNRPYPEERKEQL